MKFADFEKIMSTTRMNRYRLACSGDTRKSMTLYRLNLKISQEIFTIISCFEVALRNSIDRHYVSIHGANWLRDAQMSGGIFVVTRRCDKSKRIITRAYNGLGTNYTHPKLVAEMDFGFWRYLFASPQFIAGGQTLLNVFPRKPLSTPLVQYNQRYVFNQLKLINDIRNRIAHHEPICFDSGLPKADSNYVKTKYHIIIELFNWMDIDPAQLLYGLDQVSNLTTKLDRL